MNNVKKIFSIKDLENFSGIKAHTIRIWEKRYGLLEPNRSDSNIRNYDEKNFIKLLNISMLYNSGYKISKIAQFSEEEINTRVRELKTKHNSSDTYINKFLVSMINYDVVQYHVIFNELLLTKSFKEIFFEYLMPLLNKIGDLWQTKSILPSHEHFISNLIIQKIYANIELTQNNSVKKHDKVFVLFLPLNEIHEIALLYIYFELRLLNYNCIYLGQNTDIEHLLSLKEMFANIHFISVFTVEPTSLEFDQYLDNLYQQLIKNTDNRFLFLGKTTTSDLLSRSNKQLIYFLSIQELLKAI